NPKPQTPNPKTETSNPNPPNRNPTPYTLHPTPYTLNPNPQTPNPKPQTPNPRPERASSAAGMEIDYEPEMLPEFDMDLPEAARASGALIIPGIDVKPLRAGTNSRYVTEPWYTWFVFFI
ncbi:hypothetical protein T484DRAFT_1616161, partial [Baffinella frigidus]